MTSTTSSASVRSTSYSIDTLPVWGAPTGRRCPQPRGLSRLKACHCLVRRRPDAEVMSSVEFARLTQEWFPVDALTCFTDRANTLRSGHAQSGR